MNTGVLGRVAVAVLRPYWLVCEWSYHARWYAGLVARRRLGPHRNGVMLAYMSRRGCPDVPRIDPIDYPPWPFRAGPRPPR